MNTTPGSLGRCLGLVSLPPVSELFQLQVTEVFNFIVFKPCSTKIDSVNVSEKPGVGVQVQFDLGLSECHGDLLFLTTLQSFALCFVFSSSSILHGSRTSTHFTALHPVGESSH